MNKIVGELIISMQFLINYGRKPHEILNNKNCEEEFIIAVFELLIDTRNWRDFASSPTIQTQLA